MSRAVGGAAPRTRAAGRSARSWRESVDLIAELQATRWTLRSRPGLLAVCHAAEAEYRLGAWDDSQTHAQLAVVLAVERSDDRLLAYAHSLATWVPAARGEWGRAGTHAEHSRQLAQRLGDEISAVFAAVAAAQVGACAGEPSVVVEALTRATTREAWSRNSEPLWAASELYADALVSLGRIDEARVAVEHLEMVSPSVAMGGAAAGAARLRARMEAAKGNSERARTEFERALRQLGGRRAPWALALVHDSYGRFLRRRGERRAAARQLSAARAAFADLGARPFLERTDQELAACGITPAPRSSRNHQALTPQEAAVARLVASGRTNREVGVELALSVKTVEYHLGHVYAKLGVASRSQLAARFGDRLRVDGSGHGVQPGAIALPMEAESR